MNEPTGSSAHTGGVKPLFIAAAVLALLLTVLAGMTHGSHIGARLDGPEGWTGWVTLDVLLATAPALAALLVPASAVTGPAHARRTEIALVTWLAVAGISCSLALLWM